MALAATLTASAEWRTWSGGGAMPAGLQIGTPVAVLLRCGRVEQGFAGDLTWSHGPAIGRPDPLDIVSFRIRRQAAG